MVAVGYDAGDRSLQRPDGSFNTTGEAYWQKARARYVAPSGNASFWGGYVEVGYFFTGETRGYKNGKWDRTKVLKPFGKGGWGSLGATFASIISTFSRTS